MFLISLLLSFFVFFTDQSESCNDSGVKLTAGLRIFPSYRVLPEGKSATFCCVAPEGDNISSITFRNNRHPTTSIGATAKAITINNLTIPTQLFKSLLLTCTEASGKSKSTLNYVSFPPQKLLNLTCGTSDLKTVVCTWNSERKRDPFDKNTQTYTLHIEYVLFKPRVLGNVGLHAQFCDISGFLVKLVDMVTFHLSWLEIFCVE
ncbi:Leukemia inhibitory factor receptor [Oryzias melastigma]|uniref:Leukemia inhibitory factor receptor n=1 Tax=Oryzias melastigma TaxID=30732 RepID=A0A834CIU2_ORYME|nr:Leukemia inhibitory factor receptor [Oryzias melastigma]